MKTALNLKNRISDKISEILQSGFSMYRYLRKRCYGMGCIVTKLEETQLTSIALSVFVMNLFMIQKRILCTLFYLYRFRNRYEGWNIQISA